MYREHAPPPSLASRVECFWSIRAAPGAAPRESRILPDGCMDVLFTLGDAPHPNGRSIAVGAMQTAAMVRSAGRVDTVGVRFRPGGAAAFLRLPASELTDTTVALSELWRGEAGELEERLHGAGDGERVVLLSAALLRRLGDAPAPHPAAAYACAAIDATDGRVSVRELAAGAGLTARHLERLFAEAVGLSPRMARRVARFRAAVRRLEREQGVAWTRLALDCGFYDQAHLVRDFRALAGLTPTAYRAGLRHVASVQDADGGAA